MTGLSISKTAELGFSLEFSQNVAKNKGHPVSSSSKERTTLLMRNNSREWKTNLIWQKCFSKSDNHSVHCGEWKSITCTGYNSRRTRWDQRKQKVGTASPKLDSLRLDILGTFRVYRSVVCCIKIKCCNTHYNHMSACAILLKSAYVNQ